MRISKNILLKEIPFEAKDCHALELYLSEMDAKGWMFFSNPMLYFFSNDCR